MCLSHPAAIRIICTYIRHGGCQSVTSVISQPSSLAKPLSCWCCCHASGLPCPLCVQLNLPKTCLAHVSDMSRIRALFGLSTGGQLALTALAALAGGDYLVGGLKQVGEKYALAVISHLLQGCTVRLPADFPSRLSFGLTGRVARVLDSMLACLSGCEFACLRACIPLLVVAGKAQDSSPRVLALLPCQDIWNTQQQFTHARPTRARPCRTELSLFAVTLPAACRTMKASWRSSQTRCHATLTLTWRVCGSAQARACWANT